MNKFKVGDTVTPNGTRCGPNGFHRFGTTRQMREWEETTASLEVIAFEYLDSGDAILVTDGESEYYYYEDELELVERG